MKKDLKTRLLTEWISTVKANEGGPRARGKSQSSGRTQKEVNADLAKGRLLGKMSEM